LSNIRFGEEIGIIEIKILTLSGAQITAEATILLANHKMVLISGEICKRSSFSENWRKVCIRN